ncbi:hypothetical protein HBB16_02830 [Pseudonocardia sp. MCCB 268]|nr:hypothetical protein [Pseudonocardia cytotoxica]
MRDGLRTARETVEVAATPGGRSSGIRRPTEGTVVRQGGRRDRRRQPAVVVVVVCCTGSSAVATASNSSGATGLPND